MSSHGPCFPPSPTIREAVSTKSYINQSYSTYPNPKDCTIHMYCTLFFMQKWIIPFTVVKKVVNSKYKKISCCKRWLRKYASFMNGPIPGSWPWIRHQVAFIFSTTVRQTEKTPVTVAYAYQGLGLHKYGKKYIYIHTDNFHAERNA